MSNNEGLNTMTQKTTKTKKTTEFTNRSGNKVANDNQPEVKPITSHDIAKELYELLTYFEIESKNIKSCIPEKDRGKFSDLFYMGKKELLSKRIATLIFAKYQQDLPALIEAEKELLKKLEKEDKK